MENLDSDTGTNDIIQNICESPILTEEIDEVQEDVVEEVDDDEDIMDIKDKMRKNVYEYCSISDEISQLKNAIKEREVRHKELKNIISDFMNENCIDYFNLQTGGSINYKKTTKFKSLNKKQTLELLTHFLGNSSKAVELQNFLKSSREKIPSWDLKRKN
tara:strand:- start:3235 stop:3714 length:480 start_codon:yes stop_codon:yes gene_type:complete